jgi:hypothetical protein
LRKKKKTTAETFFETLSFGSAFSWLVRALFVLSFLSFKRVARLSGLSAAIPRNARVEEGEEESFEKKKMTKSDAPLKRRLSSSTKRPSCRPIMRRIAPWKPRLSHLLIDAAAAAAESLEAQPSREKRRGPRRLRASSPLSRRQHSSLLYLRLLRPRHAAAAAAHEEVGGAAVLSPRSGRACRSREREGQEKACSRKRQAFRFFFPVVSESLKGFDSFHFFSDSSCFSPSLPPLCR